MKLYNAIKNLEPNSMAAMPARAKTKRALQVDSSVFSQMYTYKDRQTNYGNGKLVEQIAETWTKLLMGRNDVEIESLYLDRQKLGRLDREKRIICPIDDNELFNIDIEEVYVGRAIGKIVVKGMHNEIYPSIAINISEKGEEIAYGENVEICSNFTILNSQYLLSTYDRVLGAKGGGTCWSLNEILNRLEKQMQDTEAIHKKDLEMVNQFRSQWVSCRSFHEFLGHQFSKISTANQLRNRKLISRLSGQEKNLAVTGKQLSRIASEAAFPSYNVYQWENDRTTLWNILNYGTEHIKFEHGSDCLRLLKTNRSWVELVRNYPFSEN